MNRLELIASLTKNEECVCDVGCDHAYVLVKALKEYNVKRGIAADVAAGPLSCAKESIRLNHLEDRVDFILSDGFDEINIPFTSVVIAGMGGMLMTSILKKGQEKIKGKKLILEPNTDQSEVRKWLSLNGFKIKDEYAIYDMDKYYEILVAEEGVKSLTPVEIEYGPILLRKKEEAFLTYYRKKKEMLSNVIREVKNEDVRKEKERELSLIENEVLS